MTDKVTCKNCKFNRASWFTRTFSSSIWWTCGIKKTESYYNVVDGTYRPGRYEDCSTMRLDENLCGKGAKAWMPRSKKDLFLLLKHVK
jgi:hypothetical protein